VVRIIDDGPYSDERYPPPCPFRSTAPQPLGVPALLQPPHYYLMLIRMNVLTELRGPPALTVFQVATEGLLALTRLADPVYRQHTGGVLPELCGGCGLLRSRGAELFGGAVAALRLLRAGSRKAFRTVRGPFLPEARRLHREY